MMPSFQDILTKEMFPAKGGSGSAIPAAAGVTFTVTQTDHGFTIGMPVYYTGTAWRAAKADTLATCATHVVTAVATVHVCNVTVIGKITIPGHGKTVGAYYYTSPVTAGATVTAEPTSGCVNPVFYVADASTLIILNWRLPVSLRDTELTFGSPAAPNARIWNSTATAPDRTCSTNGRFISGKVYNLVYNDIAEQMPSDGSLAVGDIAMVDLTSSTYRVTRYDGQHTDAIIGIVSGDPGFAVGVNPEYEHPVFIALKGMIWLIVPYPALFKPGDRVGVYDGCVLPYSSLAGHDARFEFHPLGVVLSHEIRDGQIKIFV